MGAAEAKCAPLSPAETKESLALGRALVRTGMPQETATLVKRAYTTRAAVVWTGPSSPRGVWESLAGDTEEPCYDVALLLDVLLCSGFRETLNKPDNRYGDTSLMDVMVDPLHGIFARTMLAAHERDAKHCPIDFDVRNTYGDTPLMIAVVWFREDVVQHIATRSSPVTLNAQDGDGNTALCRVIDGLDKHDNARAQFECLMAMTPDDGSQILLIGPVAHVWFERSDGSPLVCCSVAEYAQLHSGLPRNVDDQRQWYVRRIEEATERQLAYRDGFLQALKMFHNDALPTVLRLGLIVDYCFPSLELPDA
jgi:hypothetical protein